MELYIFNRDLNLMGILDTFTSLRWIRRYYKSGKFELHCALNKETLELLKRENIIYKKDDMEAGYIETRQLKIGVDGNEYLEIKGKFITSYLDRRINWGQVVFNGRVEELMRKLVNNNVVNPVDINRKIPNLALGDIKGFAEEIKYQNSYGNILRCLENISNTSNLGCRNILDIKNKKIIFDIYKCVDRTVNNGTIAPCIFSRDFENILEQQYFDSLNTYRNTCLIAGAGEGISRKLTSIENGTSLDRYELYVDARDIQDKKKVNNEEIIIPDAEYIPMLIQRGNEKLSECKEIQTFDSKINVLGNNKYKIDFDLGDIVTVVDKKWDVSINSRIVEIEEVYEQQGLSVNVVFGNNIPSIIDKIKNLIN